MGGFEPHLIELIGIFGFPVILFLMFSKGLLIGKPVPAIATITTYALLVGATDIADLFTITILTATATTAGEVIVFDQTRRQNGRLKKVLPQRVTDAMEDTSDNDRFKRVTHFFDDHMGLTVFTVNLITGIRGFASIPAGQRGYPLYRFVPISLVSTLIYHTVLTYVAVSGITFLL